MRRIFCAYISFSLLLSIAYFAAHAMEKAADMVIDTFSAEIGQNGIPAGWKPLFFKKIPANTRYTVEQEGDNYFVKADSRSSASGIYREIDIDPKVYNTISWRWRVENIIKKGDEKKKAGDDYAARIYVAFKYDPDRATFLETAKYRAIKLIYGKYPPRAVLNYIWANKLPKGEAADNAFTKHAKMIAVQSGDSEIGKWIMEERNLYEDYRRLFHNEPPHIMAIAIMTDTDNTGESAVAYYDDIVLMSKSLN